MMINNLRNHIANFIEKNELNIKTFEQNHGFNSHSIRNILTGKSKNPGIEVLGKLANVLEVPIDSLLRPVPPESDSTSLTNQLLHLAYHVFMHVFNEIENYETKDEIEVFSICADIYNYCKEANKGKFDETYANWKLKQIRPNPSSQG